MFLSLVNQTFVDKAISMKTKIAMKDEHKQAPGTIGVHVLAYLSKSEEDELTLDSLNQTDVPKMMAEDVDLPIFVDKTKYDSQKHVKVRIVSKNDWGRVDWDTMQLINKSNDPVHFDTVILHVHGGSFNHGSTGDLYPISKKYSIETGHPIFSVDYRLAPEFQFPKGLSDCFQVYMWLVKYSKKYLQLTFDRIIIDGDSAGANFVLSLTGLSINKNIRIPDKLVLHYAWDNICIRSFCPSLALSLEDPLLNYHFLPYIWHYYADFEHQSNQYASPKFLDEEILKKFPPCTFFLAENDPIRDELLRLCLRLSKVGKQDDIGKKINSISSFSTLFIEVKIFKHWYHGFMFHASFQARIKMAYVALKMSIEALK